MKRNRVLILIVVISLLCFVSCTSSRLIYTQNDAENVMNEVLDITLNKAMTKTASYLNSTEDYVPDFYSPIVDKRNIVAGLDTLLKEWADYSKDCFLGSLDQFQDYIQGLRITFDLENASYLAVSGSTSLSDLFEKKFREEIVSNIKSMIMQLDTSKLEKAVNHYNKWVQANINFNTSSGLEKLEISEISDSLSEELTDVFFSFMSSSEELYRTTPSPDMENITAAVLGLN